MFVSSNAYRVSPEEKELEREKIGKKRQLFFLS
jgi:hypothetical protein